MSVITDQIGTIVARLKARWPGATYELDWTTPEQMLVATTLAAQCTDERVNRVTRTLFVKYPNPKAFADADDKGLEEDLKPTGFYRQKTKAVKAINRAIVDRYSNQVPKTMPEMLTIKGVARKTANVVLNCCFNLPTGVIVDTHVKRVSQRMGLSKKKGPEQIEKDLMKLIPPEEWTFFGPAMVMHGRYTCTAKAPRCDNCIYLDICPRIGVAGPKPDASAMTLPPPVSDTPGVDTWVSLLAEEMDKPYFDKLQTFVDDQRAQHPIHPPEDEVFSAYGLTPFEDLKVLILGQDPYHGPGQAHGLSFSVKPGVAVPPSLKNIYKELQADLGIKPPTHGYLTGWARQGVMMLNAVLTVQERKPNSHKSKGWETFTDATIKMINARKDHVVFVLWGGYAQKKARLIDASKHTIIKTAHPSPLSVKKFRGTKPFSAVNAALKKKGQAPVDWGAL